MLWKVGGSVLLIAALGLAGVRWLNASRSDAAEITATAVRATLPITVTERGELESSKTVSARCEVEGERCKIVEILPEGSQIKKGQIVVRFDADELKRRHAEQEIKVKQAEGRFEAAEQELKVQQNKALSEIADADLALQLAELDLKKYTKGDYLVEVSDKQGAISLAEKDLAEAKEKLANYRDFVKKGFGTQQQLRTRESDVDYKTYYLKRDREKLGVLQNFTRERQERELTVKAEQAKRKLERIKASTEATVKKAKSDLEANQVTANLEKAQLERIGKQLKHCVVEAPQDGILVYFKYRYDDESRIRPGAMVYYQQNLFSLPDLTQMQVKVKIHEALVKKVKAGQKAEIRVDAYPNHVLEGVVENVATLADSERYWDESVKEYITIVKINNLPLEAGLKPGMTGEVKILVNELADVLLVPVQAITEKEGKHYAYVANGEEEIERREVEVGENNEKFIEIKEGLDAGDHVALDARSRMTAESKALENQIPVPEQKSPGPKAVTSSSKSPAPGS